MDKSIPVWIAPLLYDRNEIVQIASMEALTMIGDEKAKEHIWVKLRYGNEKVSRTAAKCMEELGLDIDALELAQGLADFEFGWQTPAATEALTRLDRKLYCPFNSSYRDFYPMRWSIEAQYETSEVSEE